MDAKPAKPRPRPVMKPKNDGPYWRNFERMPGGAPSLGGAFLMHSTSSTKSFKLPVDPS